MSMKYYSYKQMRFMLLQRLRDAGLGVGPENFSFQITVHLLASVHNFDNVDDALEMIHRLTKEGSSFWLEVKLVNDINMFKQLRFVDYE